MTENAVMAPDEHSLEQFSHLLSGEEIKRYSRLDNKKFLIAVAAEIASIALMIWVSETFWNPLLYVLAVIIIGSRIHAMAVLVHDTAHYRGVTNRKWNDFIGETLALLTPLTMEGYRSNHFTHHRELNTDKDPDWVRKKIPEFAYPKAKKDLIVLLCQYVTGIKTLQQLTAFRRDKSISTVSRRLKIRRAAFYTILAGLSIVFGFWKVLILYWLIPLHTTFIFFLYVRSVAEHFSTLKYEHVLNHSRTVEAPFWERWLFAQGNLIIF